MHAKGLSPLCTEPVADPDLQLPGADVGQPVIRVIRDLHSDLQHHRNGSLAEGYSGRLAVAQPIRSEGGAPCFIQALIDWTRT